ncbi:PKD domain-containing protein [Marinobacter sp.]|uniref:PKD domain-containing protein n=1 Tax=Marinobacter sp. TaxID=50741 RepID=UPI0034A2D03A
MSLVLLALWATAPVAFAKANPWGHASVAVQSTVNGESAHEEPGHIALIGDPIHRRIFVENNGETKLMWVTVFDGQASDHVPACVYILMFPGEKRECSLSLASEEGPHALTTYVAARGVFWWAQVSAIDVRHYYGIPDYPSVEVHSFINGEAASAAPGPELTEGEEYERSFSVTNTGPLELNDVEVSLVSTGGNDTETVCVLDQLGPDDEQQCRSTAVAEVGNYQANVTVTGSAVAKLTAEAETTIYYTGVEDEQLAAHPRATPDQGPAPLSVTFTPDVTTDTAIERYQWDLDGNGSFERSETVGRNQQYTYSEPGEYEATLRVTDSRGEVVDGTVKVTVTNSPPKITSAEASPSTGELPLAVRFSVTAEDSDGIESVAFDLDGDGTYNVTEGTNGINVTVTTDHVYEEEGNFQPRIQVTDGLGEIATASFPTLEVRALEEGSPSVTASASPQSGKAPLEVNLAASASDPDGLEMTTWEWDLDGDGTYDMQSTSSPDVTHTYQRPGTYFPRVRVTAEDGQTTEDVVRIEVTADFDLTVTADTIDATLGDTVNIKTELGGDVPVSVVLETPGGSVARTLVPWTERAHGQYTDTWDGKDDEGQPVKEGEYRAILLYEIDDEIRRLDAGAGTGGQQYNPSRSRIPSSFKPLAGEPLKITFTLPRASEVTAFMGLFRVNTRLVTFMQREVLGKGTHEITWNGEDDSGALIQLPSNESFLFGIWGWYLPDNAIFVRSGAHVTSLNVSPKILVPSSRAREESNREATLDFTLEGQADIEVTIDNTETGTRVFKQTYPAFEEGENSLTWDGRGADGDYVAPGTYRIGITAIDGQNHRSMTVFGLQQVYY